MSLLLLFVGAKTASKAAGFVSTGKVGKRWWEELQEEYQAQYARQDKLRASKSKKAVVARREAKRIAEDLYEGGLLDSFNAPELAQKVVAIQYVPRLDETLRILAEIKRIRQQLMDEQDEEETLLLLM